MVRFRVADRVRVGVMVVHEFFGRVFSLVAGGTFFHCDTNDIGTFPPDVWWLICRFLPPINAMQLLRIPSFFHRMHLRRPIVQKFMNFLMERLAEYMPYPSMLMALLCEYNPMDNPRAIISGSMVLK